MDEATAALTPEDRLAQDLCAECGLPLTGLDVPHHMMTHWPQFIRPDGLNAEAIRRQGLMQTYADSHPVAARTAKLETAHPGGRPMPETRSTTTSRPS